jgi:hypothetical protein
MHVTTLISAAITLAGALVVLAWMPGRPAAATAAREGGPGTAGDVAAEIPAAVPAQASAEG